MIILICLNPNLWGSKKYLLPYFFFAQNFDNPHPDFFPEAWSLCVEEWFYLLIPLLIVVFIKISKLSPKKSIAVSAVTIILAVTFFRYYKFLHINMTEIREWELFFRKQVITRLDSLMFGVIAAYLNHYFYKQWIKHKKFLFAGGVFIFIFSKFVIMKYLVSKTGFYNSVFSFSITSIATLMLLPYLNELKSGKGIVYKAITRISLISYSMYLLNLSIIQWKILNRINWTDILDNNCAVMFSKYALYWMLVIVLSNLLYKYWEVPMMKLRDNQRIKKWLRI